MKTYCPVRPRNRFRSRSICAGVKAIQSTTTSNDAPARACAAPGASSMSRVSVLTPAGRPAVRRPRVASVRSMPRWAASWVHAELIIPVPPMKRTLMQQLYQSHGCGGHTGALVRSCKVFLERNPDRQLQSAIPASAQNAAEGGRGHAAVGLAQLRPVEEVEG